MNLEYTRQLLQDQEYLALVKRLEQKEKQRPFCRHGLSHFLDVARIAWILTLEQANQEEMDVEYLAQQKDKIYLTALLHDLGRLAEYNHTLSHGHAQEGVIMVWKFLKRIGYPENKAKEIVDAVREHSGEQKTNHDLSDVIQAADNYSRNCFFCDAQQQCYWSEERRNKTILC